MNFAAQFIHHISDIHDITEYLPQSFSLTPLLTKDVSLNHKKILLHLHVYGFVLIVKNSNEYQTKKTLT